VGSVPPQFHRPGKKTVGADDGRKTHNGADPVSETCKNGPRIADPAQPRTPDPAITGHGNGWAGPVPSTVRHPDPAFFRRQFASTVDRPSLPVFVPLLVALKRCPLDCALLTSP
jgi:hypothetical protein